MNNFAKGSKWRRWELHIHTPNTLKNDQFKGANSEEKWGNYYTDIHNYITEEIDKNIAVIAITDYLSIDNYLKVKKDNRLPMSVKLILPNVELRISPVTGKEKPINIHCIFSPELDSELENRFFGKLKFSYGATSYSASKSELIRFGRDCADDNTLNERLALNKAREQFVIPIVSLNELFKEDRELREKTIIIVANGSNDGASGLNERNHSNYIINSHSQLAATRQEIYKMADAIFSSSLKDIKYFLAQDSDNIKTIQRKYGALMPCFHGSDAHTNSKIFNPDNNQFCWIKADLTFQGLKHAINDPIDRVFIGQIPDILKKIANNQTKYIKTLHINTVEGKEDETEQWFQSIEIPFNNELVAIIGNKGSGKSAIADIIGLCADSENHNDFLFLHPDKFKNNKGLSSRFIATLEFESGTKTQERPLDYAIEKSSRQKVRYLPQSYFEKICNNIEDAKSFRNEIEKVVFQYVSDSQKFGTAHFSELVSTKEDIVTQEIKSLANQLSTLNETIIALEDKKNPQYKSSLLSEKAIKQEELRVHLINKPDKKEIPQTTETSAQQKELDILQQQHNRYVDENSQLKDKIDAIVLEIHILESLIREINSKKTEFDRFVTAKNNQLEKFGLSISDIIQVTLDLSSLDSLIQNKKTDKDKLEISLAKVNLEFHQCVAKINTIKQKLTAEQLEYQNNLESLALWNSKKLAIEGNENTPNTLAFFAKEIKYIDADLVQEIETKRNERLLLTKQIYAKKIEIKTFYDEVKTEIDKELSKIENKHFEINSSFFCDSYFNDKVLSFINKAKAGTFSGKEESKSLLNTKIKSTNWNIESNIELFLTDIIACLEQDKRDEAGKNTMIDELVKDRKAFYDYLFALNYLTPHYQLQQQGKSIEQLSPGEKGALLLIFYLVLDKEEIPLIIDQPEDNLDNKSVATVLVPYIREAKKRRQIIMVTHNPNLAVVADAEQIIRVHIDKEDNNKFHFISGGIENPAINEAIVDILEGTMPAFSSRKAKYHAELSIVRINVDINSD
ncbi:MAG: hypothetical protein WAX77_06215 [Methylococcaceae bacterium]